MFVLFHAKAQLYETISLLMSKHFRVFKFHINITSHVLALSWTYDRAGS